jgi:nuclease S1
MDTAEARKQAQDWATESLLAARQAYQDPATGRRIKSGTRLGDAYQEAGLPVAKRRLYQAGMRLAMLLNEVFPAD